MREASDVKQIAAFLLRKLHVIFACSALAAVLGLVLAVYIISPRYTSTVSLYVNNTAESAATSAVNINDINASQKLVNTYIVILQDDEVMEQVAAQLLEEYPPETLARSLPLEARGEYLVLTSEILRRVIQMSSVNNTEVLRITAVTGDAGMSARICNLMTEIAPGVLQRVVKAGSVETIGAAKPAEIPTFPNTRVFGAAGLLAGLVLSASAVLLVFLLDNTVKSEDDIRARFNIPVLGEIPGHEPDFKRSFEKYAD